MGFAYSRAMARSRGPTTPQPAPDPKRADSQEIVESILTAAIALGPDATTNAIAERAGVGIASLYRYFPSPVAIFAEISRRMHRQFLEQLRAITVRPELSLAGAIREVCRIAVETPGVPVAMRQRLNLDVPLSWTKDSADDTYKTALDAATEWLRHHLAAPPADLGERVFVAFSAIRGAVLMAMLYPELAPPSEELIDQLAANTLRCLTSSP